MKMKTAVNIDIEGVVQGVGFRPFVHRLADRFGLNGYVLNTSEGITIHAEAERPKINAFIKALRAEVPPLARITGITSRPAAREGIAGFFIRESKKTSRQAALVSPDIGICAQCLAEMSRNSDRRFRYPFINCTNCGPRYSIIYSVPYDRPATTMKAFNMCMDCATEYNDIRSRRYHAQPNACFVCGPQVSLLSGDRAVAAGEEAITEAIRHIRAGSIVAIKGIGGFHIACDARNAFTVQRLRTLKKRPSKPFAVMVADPKKAQMFADISQTELALLNSPERPVVLLKKKASGGLCQELSPDNNYIGVMICYTPLHYLLFDRGLSDGRPLDCIVMTSGNVADEPLEIDNAQAVRNLSGICDHFLVHNRDIHNRVDDSIVQVMNDTPVMLRRSRGYAPFPFFAGSAMKPTLACGAELKNTFCLAKDSRFFLSQYIGDLKTYATYQFYREAVARMEKLFSIKPSLVVHDLHPEYLSSHYAAARKSKKKKIGVIAVQHHRSHCASVIAEHDLKGKVIGVCFDGIGYGADGKIWGGEFFHGTLADLRRVGHLEYVPMPGGDKATQEPLRMAISYLYQAFGEGIYRLNIGFVNKHQNKLADFISLAKLKPVMTSSAGRLFDAVSAILGICERITYEAQAAIRLQMFAERSRTNKAYRFDIFEEEKTLIVTSDRAFGQIVDDLKNYVSREDIARKFHNGLADITVRVCGAIRTKTKTRTVCLSGGVFQNKLLLESVTGKLRKKNFIVYYNEILPSNDGAVSLGQAALANA